MVGRRAYARLHSDERREQLVARATELFATHGYEELSMSRIAREAGISKASSSRPR
jgi:AcrR family transcriptional regulator